MRFEACSRRRRRLCRHAGRPRRPRHETHHRRVRRTERTLDRRGRAVDGGAARERATCVASPRPPARRLPPSLSPAPLQASRLPSLMSGESTHGQSWSRPPSQRSSQRWCSSRPRVRRRCASWRATRSSAPARPPCSCTPSLCSKRRRPSSRKFRNGGRAGEPPAGEAAIGRCCVTRAFVF